MVDLLKARSQATSVAAFSLTSSKCKLQSMISQEAERLSISPLQWLMAAAELHACLAAALSVRGLMLCSCNVDSRLQRSRGCEACLC